MYWLISNQNPNSYAIQAEFDKLQEKRDANEKKTSDLEAEIKSMEELFERTKQENGQMKVRIDWERKFHEEKTTEENFAKSECAQS